MTENEIPGVRESRRRAMLAKAIVDQFSGPRAQLEAFTRQSPLAAIVTAFVCGALVGVLLRGKK